MLYTYCRRMLFCDFYDIMQVVGVIKSTETPQYLGLYCYIISLLVALDSLM